MNRLQLATLLSWAGDGGFQGRKRLQKVAFLLQEAGCPLKCRYTLHYFGPYSRDVADICDELVAADLVDESGRQAAGGLQYTYMLKPATRQLLQKTPDEQTLRFESLGKKLIKQDIWTLELGSTILFFYRQSDDWGHALTRACEFKKASVDDAASRAALALAQDVRAIGN